MHLYFKTANGSIKTSVDIADAALIVDNRIIPIDDHEAIRNFVRVCCLGIEEELHDVTVEYLISNGYKTRAIELYYDTHKFEGVTLKEAKETVEKMMKDLKSSQ